MSSHPPPPLPVTVVVFHLVCIDVWTVSLTIKKGGGRENVWLLSSNSLFATLDPFVSILSAVALLSALRVQLLVAELLWSSSLWARGRGTEETGVWLHSLDTLHWKQLMWTSDETVHSSYLAPRCIYTGSPWFCTLRCSSVPEHADRDKQGNKGFLYIQRTLLSEWKTYLVYLAEVTVLFVKVRRALQTHTSSLTHAHLKTSLFVGKYVRHLSRVTRARLWDIAVIHGIAATVTPWVELTRREERVSDLSPTCCISVFMDGTGRNPTRHVLLQQGPPLQCAPLAREHFLQHSVSHSWKQKRNVKRLSKQTRHGESDRVSPLCRRSRTPLPLLQTRSRTRLARTAAKRRVKGSGRMCGWQGRVHRGGGVWGPDLGRLVEQTRASAFQKELLVVGDAAFGESPRVTVPVHREETVKAELNKKEKLHHNVTWRISFTSWMLVHDSFNLHPVWPCDITQCPPLCSQATSRRNRTPLQTEMCVFGCYDDTQHNKYTTWKVTEKDTSQLIGTRRTAQTPLRP